MPEFANPCAAMCAALGFDPNKIRGLTLRAYDGDPPTLEVEHILDVDQVVDDVHTVVRHYSLVADDGERVGIEVPLGETGTLEGDGSGQVLPPFDGSAEREAPAWATYDMEPDWR